MRTRSGSLLPPGPACGRSAPGTGRTLFSEQQTSHATLAF